MVFKTATKPAWMEEEVVVLRVEIVLRVLPMLIALTQNVRAERVLALHAKTPCFKIRRNQIKTAENYVRLVKIIKIV